MFRKLLLAGLAIFLGACPSASEPATDENRASTITITKEDGAFLTHIRNVRFEIGEIVEETQSALRVIRLVVAIEIERRLKDAIDQETETLDARIRANARPIGDDGALGSPTLDLDVAGDEAAISGPFFIVTTWGCCALQSSHAIYSLKSGRALFSATGAGDYGEWITLGSSRRPDDSRYVASFVAPTLSDVAELGDDHGRVAAIAYASETRPLQRLLVVSELGRDSDVVLNWLPALAWITPDQPQGTDHVFVAKDAAAAETYDGFVLRLQLDEATRIEIPLEKDRLVAAKATLPKGFSLIEAPVE